MGLSISDILPITHPCTSWLCRRVVACYMGTFQHPRDVQPSETPFYKLAALQGGGWHAPSSVSFVCVHTYTLLLSLLPQGQDQQERYKQVAEGSPLLLPPSPIVAEVALGGSVPPDMGTYPRKLCQPAQRAGSSLPGCRETGREREARASMPFPVPEESCSFPRLAAFSPHLPPPPWLSVLGASQPHDATLGCVWTSWSLKLKCN